MKKQVRLQRNSRALATVVRKLRVLEGMKRDAEVASLMARSPEERLDAEAHAVALRDAIDHYRTLRWYYQEG